MGKMDAAAIEHHRKRHEELHDYFDELFADYVVHGEGSTNDTIFMLMQWSAKQVEKPDHNVRMGD